MWAFCCDGLSCCYQQRRRRDDAEALSCFLLYSFLSAVQMHFRPEAIKSHYDKVQHQNKIMRQIRGIKKWGEKYKRKKGC